MKSVEIRCVARTDTGEGLAIGVEDRECRVHHVPHPWVALIVQCHTEFRVTIHHGGQCPNLRGIRLAAGCVNSRPQVRDIQVHRHRIVGGAAIQIVFEPFSSRPLLQIEGFEGRHDHQQSVFGGHAQPSFDRRRRGR